MPTSAAAAHALTLRAVDSSTDISSGVKLVVLLELACRPSDTNSSTSPCTAVGQSYARSATGPT